MTKEQGPGFYRFKVGDFHAAAVSDGYMHVDYKPHVMVAGSATENQYRDYMKSRFLNPDKLFFQVSVLLVDTGKYKVLIDNGLGANGGTNGGFLVQHLNRLGIAAGDIDVMLFSHAHLDHVSGTLAPDNSLTFPNARYFIGEKEYAFWTKPEVILGSAWPAEVKQVFVETAKRALGAISDRVELMQPGQEVVPGIAAEAAFGHSPGQLAFHVSSGNETLLYTSDTFHHAPTAIEHPSWAAGVDGDASEGVRTRRRMVDWATANKPLVMVPHFPFPSVGHISQIGEYRKWEPVVWQWS
jgi:glyoxylase-like metal-dependent hydrolase (beta-lactamase superfamily II)